MNKRLGLIFGILLAVGILALIGFGISRHACNVNAKRVYLEAEGLLKVKDYDAAAGAFEKVSVDFSKSAFSKKVQFGLAQAYLEAGKLQEARQAYTDVLSLGLDYEDEKLIRQKLADLNLKILFSPIVSEDSVSYKVSEGDTLQGIAQKHNTTVALIKRANNLKSDIIKPGRNLKVTTAKFSIIVDKSFNTLTLKSGEGVFKMYSVSTGADNSTPVGVFKITNKIVNPPWFREGKVIPAADPKNILGSRWLGLTVKGYGIHGTKDDASIGKQCTQGCVRMHNNEVEELFDIVPEGAEVTIVD